MVGNVILLASVAVSSTCGVVQHQVVRRQVVAPVQRVVKQQVVYSNDAAYSHVPTYAPQTLYFVGAPIRIQSLVEQQKATDPDYQDYLKFKRWQEGAKAAQQSQYTQPQQHMPPSSDHSMPPDNPMPPGLTVKEACGHCHGKSTPDGAFFLDGSFGIEASRVTKAIRAIGDGTMPKDRKLSSTEKNQLLQDLLSLESQDDGGR